MKKIDKTESLRQILSCNKFTVNYYQREYRWGRKQIEQLLDDLISAFYSYYDPKFHNDPQVVEEYGYYYMGSIIRTGDSNKEIIDGQQRLTSLTLLLMYLNNLLKEQGKKIESLSSMIFSEAYMKKTFNINVEDRKSCFENLYVGNTDFMPENESSANMLERYKDIDDLFPDDLRGDALLLFTYFVMEKILLLEIVAPSEKEAQTIFVTMNDRGLSLNSAEMLKAFILQECPISERKELNAKWQKIIADIKNSSDDAKNGSVNTEDVTFISNWLRAKYALTQRETKKGAVDEDYELLGEKFHEWARTNARKKMNLLKPDDFKNFIVEEMTKMSSLYLTLKKYSKKLTDGFEKVYYNANKNLNYQNMLIMSAVDIFDDEETIKRKINLVATFVDVFSSIRIFNYMKVNYNSNKYVLFRLMNLIRNKSVKEIGIILTQTINNMGVSFEAIGNFGLNQFTKSYMLHILARFVTHIDLEMEYPNRFESYVARKAKVTYDIEHALPDDYESYQDLFGDEDEFNRYRQMLGNLLILTYDKNRSYQDMPYIDKQQYYLRDNIIAQSMNELTYSKNPRFIPLAKKYGIKSYDVLNKDAILERTNVYKMMAKEIWNVNELKDIAGGWNEDEEKEVSSETNYQKVIVDDDGLSPENEWIIPCNIAYYDVITAFNELDILPWSVKVKLKPGDVAYIYLALPYMQIKYKCLVIDVDVPVSSCNIDDSKYYKTNSVRQTDKIALLKLVRVYEDNAITKKQILEVGCKSNFQGAMRLTKELKSLILSVENR